MDVGSSKDKTFVLKNDGASDLKINKAQVAGSNAEQYAVLDLDIPAVLAPGASREVTVRFSPTSSGIKKGQVMIEPTLSLMGIVSIRRVWRYGRHSCSKASLHPVFQGDAFL